MKYGVIGRVTMIGGGAVQESKRGLMQPELGGVGCRSACGTIWVRCYVAVNCMCRRRRSGGGLSAVEHRVSQRALKEPNNGKIVTVESFCLMRT
jgi:hypothetical protein